MTQNLKNWGLKNYKRPAKGDVFLRGLVSEANATDPVTLAVISSVASGSMDNLVSNLAVTYALEGSSTAAAAGAVTGATLATAAAIVAGTVIVAVAAAGVVICESEVELHENYYATRAKGRNRLNCYSEPLSWVGLNPRENLYVQNIDCKSNLMSVQLESQLGKTVERKFLVSEGKLIAADISADQKTVFANSKTPKEASTFKALEKDFATYKALCENPTKLAAFKKEVEKLKAKGNIHTDQKKSHSAK